MLYIVTSFNYMSPLYVCAHKLDLAWNDSPSYPPETNP